MKKGLIVPKGFGLVYVYTTNKGGRYACFNTPREKLCEYNEYEYKELRYTLYGVFMYDIEKRRKKVHDGIHAMSDIQPYGDEFGDVGMPEGFTLKYESKYVHGEYVKTNKIVLVPSVHHYTRSFIERRRENYCRKLKAINKKAQELIELGVERAAAINAAKKCACVH